MQRWRPRLDWSTIAGPLVRVGEITVTPRATAVTLRVGGNAVLVWNRPVGVDVAQAGVVRRVRIVDLRRLVWLGLGGVLVLSLFLMAAASSPRKERDQ